MVTLLLITVGIEQNLQNNFEILLENAIVLHQQNKEFSKLVFNLSDRNVTSFSNRVINHDQSQSIPVTRFRC